MRYVGLDLHPGQFTMAVVDESGTMLFEHSYPTSADNLIGVLDAVSEPKVVVFEESTLAAWVWRTLAPHVGQVVVAEPWHNHLISGDEDNDDVASAVKLAELYRGGFIKAVHHTGERGQVFKELVLFYHDTARELARFKNKLKSKLQQHGLYVVGAEIYDQQHRDAYLQQIDADGARLQAQLLLDTIDHLTDQKAAARAEVIRHCAAIEPIGRLRELPGIGPIRAATFVAIVDTPQRFATKRKLWSYCGLGVANRSSGDSEGPEHLNRRYNRRLKAVAKGAAIAAINHGDNQFARQYHRLIADGIRAHNARLTVARAIITTMWAIWRSGQRYRPRG